MEPRVDHRWDIEQLLSDKAQLPAKSTKSAKGKGAKGKAKAKEKSKVLEIGAEKRSRPTWLNNWHDFVQGEFKKGGKTFKQCLVHCKPLYASQRTERVKKARGVAAADSL